MQLAYRSRSGTARARALFADRRAFHGPGYALSDIFPVSLFPRKPPPINPAGESPTMQITVTVSDVVVREAGARGLPIDEFIESLIDKGMLESLETKERPVLNSAIERIRALRTTAIDTKR
jgi:hypothetical protein